MGKRDLGTGKTQTRPLLARGLTKTIAILFKMLAKL